ncbi:MAG TPA: hypothetical protein PKW56_07195 [Clostridiales bacterium]|nr:hypothetical protein [Clostridiales bacterium]
MSACRNKIITVLLIILLTAVFSAEKATLVYKNGTTLDCMIEKYEVGKYAEIIDEKGNKRIVSWDNINEIIFVKAEETPADDGAVSESLSAPPAVVPATPVPVPAAATPSVSSGSDSGSGGSMLDQFKAKKEADDSGSKPKNAAERWAEKNSQTSQEVTPEEENVHIQEIRQENEYQKPEVDLNKKTGKLSVEYYKTLESDSKRRSWIEQGGILKGTGMTVNYTFASMEMEGMDTDFTMNGFGMTYSGTLKWVRPPNYDEGKNTWSAFSLGAMGSFNTTFGSMDSEYTFWNGSYFQTITTEMNLTMFAFEFSGNIGYTFGLGRYFSPEDWKGVMLGLYWKPNYVMSRSTTEIDGNYYEGDPQSSFNMSGFQWTIDFGSFGALADKLAKEAHFSINGFIIPETDETPFMLSIGLGMVWY